MKDLFCKRFVFWIALRLCVHFVQDLAQSGHESEHILERVVQRSRAETDDVRFTYVADDAQLHTNELIAVQRHIRGGTSLSRLAMGRTALEN